MRGFIWTNLSITTTTEDDVINVAQPNGKYQEDMEVIYQVSVNAKNHPDSHLQIMQEPYSSLASKVSFTLLNQCICMTMTMMFDKFKNMGIFSISRNICLNQVACPGFIPQVFQTHTDDFAIVHCTRNIVSRLRSSIRDREYTVSLLFHWVLKNSYRTELMMTYILPSFELMKFLLLESGPF